jgi:hypothetical protein
MVKIGWSCRQSVLVVVVVVVVVLVLVWIAGAFGSELELELEAGPLSATRAVDSASIPTAKIRRFMQFLFSKLRSLFEGKQCVRGLRYLLSTTKRDTRRTVARIMRQGRGII